ncbi:MAG: DNAse [Pseudomonas sp.]|nr:DNAse [Pseudomonas sp.]MBB52358.1 DNAse [Pseudomonadales bacterium]
MRQIIPLLRTCLLAACLIASGLASASDIIVGTWNVKRLGHGDRQNFTALAEVAQRVDLLALQEVMNEEGLERLELAVERQSGESWSTIASHAIGSSSYKEMYAFLLRDSAVEYDEGAVVYLDRGDRFMREPFSAQFRSKRDQSKIAIGTVHIVYGKSQADRTPEIRALADYWSWLGDVYPGTPRMLVGDFNLNPNNPAWAPLKQFARPLITTGGTTLSSVNGRFASLYDNFWIERESTLDITSSGVINFPAMIGWSHEKSRAEVSDHAPVFIALGRARLDATASVVQSSERSSASTGASTRNNNGSLASSLGLASKAFAGGVRGNRRSQIYHRPDCPSYNRIGANNRVEFPSADAAISAGYRLAGNCG